MGDLATVAAANFELGLASKSRADIKLTTIGCSSNCPCLSEITGMPLACSRLIKSTI